MTKVVPRRALQFHQFELRLGAQLLVERGKRFVEQENAGPFDQSARQRHALTLAAGKLVDAALAVAIQPQQRQHLLDARGDLTAFDLLLAQTEADIALDGEMREQRVVLEHHVDRPPVRRHGADVLAVEQDAAFARRLEAGQHAQQGRLAAAGRAEQREKLSLRDIQIDVVDGRERAKPLHHTVETHQYRPAGRRVIRHRVPSSEGRTLSGGAGALNRPVDVGKTCGASG